MTIHRKDIDARFGSGAIPPESQLVVMDGYDEWDKKHAVKLFRGKTQDDVYRELVAGGMRSISETEDMIVLTPDAFRYYLAPYLTYLSCDVEGDLNEDETVHFFYFAFKEYVRINGLPPFDDGQRRLVCDVLLDCLERVRLANGEPCEWRDDLISNLEYLLRAFGVAD